MIKVAKYRIDVFSRYSERFVSENQVEFGWQAEQNPEVSPEDEIMVTFHLRSSIKEFNPDKILRKDCKKIYANTYQDYRKMFYRQFDLTPEEFVNKQKANSDQLFQDIRERYPIFEEEDYKRHTLLAESLSQKSPLITNTLVVKYYPSNELKIQAKANAKIHTQRANREEKGGGGNSSS